MTNDALLEKLVRFQQPEKVLPYARDLSARTVAAIFGTDEGDYRRAREELDRQRNAAVQRLEPLLVPLLGALPFQPGAHLAAIGESSTADRLSWFEILRSLLEAHRPDLQLRFTNFAVPGATTTEALSALPAVQRQAPDWVFCKLGTNDSQRLGGPAGTMLVSQGETLRNLAEIRRLSLPDGKGTWVWVTPTLVDESRIASFPHFAAAGITWTNADLDDLTKRLPTGSDVVVNGSAVASEAAPNAFGEDGIHPTITTHEVLCTQILQALT